MFSKIVLDLKNELYKEQSRVNTTIKIKENELKKLYEEKNNHDRNHEILRKNKENLQTTFILIQKKLINKKKREINKLIELNKKKDNKFKVKNIENNNQLSEKDKKIKFHQTEYTQLSNDLFNMKKKYKILQKNLSILELERNEILEKIKKLSNIVNPTNIIVNKNNNNLNEVSKIEKSKNFDLNKAIHKIFE